MNAMWAVLMACGCAAALFVGGGETLTQAASEAVTLCIRMAGGFALFSGLMQIVEEAGALAGLQRALRRPMARLFPSVDPDGEAARAMSANLAANMLGLGNAATPMGLRAMELLGRECRGGAATDAMCTFMVLGAAGVQLFPASVVALRAASGSADPADIVLPTLAATAFSAAVGVGACRVFSRLWGD